MGGGRSIWKGPFILPLQANTPTKSRAVTITGNLIGNNYLIHNGKSFAPVLVTEDMVNHKLGDFVLTRKPFSYKKDDKKGRGKR